MTDTALTTTSEPRAIAAMAIGPAAEVAVAGTETLGREDLIIPRLTLVQGTSRNLPDGFNKHLGEWFNDVTGEYQGQVHGVLLAIAKARVAFPRQFSGDSDPVCASDDALYPRDIYVATMVRDDKTGMEYAIGGACAECPLSKFGPLGEPPMCAKVYNYAFLDIGSGMPFVLRAQRTGAKEAKKLNTVAMMTGRKKITVIASKFVTDASGNYYVPSFSIGPATPPEMLALAMSMAELGNLAARQSAADDSPDAPKSPVVAGDDTKEEIPF